VAIARDIAYFYFEIDSIMDPMEDDTESELGIVIFDYDGVLNRGSSWQAVHNVLGTTGEAADNHEQHRREEITFEEWGYLDAKLWEGASKQQFRQALNEIDTVDNIAETVSELQDRGYVVGIVSGGIRSLIESSVDGDFDFIVANEVTLDDGVLTGEVTMDVTAGTKPDHYRRLGDVYDVSLTRSITIGDSIDDFYPLDSGLNIAFNAEESVQDVADVIIENTDLSCLVPVTDAWRSGVETAVNQ
jgi:phosphoserine phosphatase